MDKAIPIALLFASTFLWQNMLLFMKWLETSIPLLITTNFTAIEVMPIYNTQIFHGTRSKAMWLQRYLQSISQRVFSEIHINGPRWVIHVLNVDRILLEVSKKTIVRQNRARFTAIFKSH